MKILVTGGAGFIGSHLIKRLVSQHTIVNLDNLSPYYDVNLKLYRLRWFESASNYKFVCGSILDKRLLTELFNKYHFDVVIHLAAQTGVRYSRENPETYLKTNVEGFFNILEVCKQFYVKHLIYASSSSVYGNLQGIQSVDCTTDKPLSFYAATKKSNELFAYYYSQSYNLSTTGLRFFTVYGPAGRPDMLYYTFTDRVLYCEPIFLFNNGLYSRDFTYIDDVVEGITKVLTPRNLYNIYNIGHGQPVKVLDFIAILQEELVRASIVSSDFDFEALKTYIPDAGDDVQSTYADTTLLQRDFGFTPKVSCRDGLRKFVKWYKKYNALS